jgi:hypothetical protein
LLDCYPKICAKPPETMPFRLYRPASHIFCRGKPINSGTLTAPEPRDKRLPAISAPAET